MGTQQKSIDWKTKLSDEQYRVLREKATEPAFTGKLLNNHEKGLYMCAACGAELFSSEHKFDSGSGWPSFFDLSKNQAVNLVPDFSHGMERVEVVCRNCGSHLGHLFDDAPQTPTGQRYCINSVALDFQKTDAVKTENTKGK